MNKKILLSMLFVHAILINVCVGLDQSKPCDVVIGSHAAVDPQPRLDKDWWVLRHQAVLDRVAEGNVDLLMIGDSITHGWDGGGKVTWGQYYASRNAVNLGFSGDRTEHVLWRLQNGEIENIDPKLAVLMIGTNNSGGDQYSAEQIADGIKAIVCTLRTKLPDTKIVILSIFPRGDQGQRADKQHGASYNDQWAKNDEASQLASEIADEKMVFYMDINQVFLDEQGVLSRAVMPDLLHPKEKGYALWAEAMESTVAKLMGEAK
ncbi:GDSL-type esterase/lipase family protein [Coraliomargarita sp. W4R53]